MSLCHPWCQIHGLWYLIPVFISLFSWTWFAACTASYIGVVSDRGWRGSMVGRSVCVCGRQLRWAENIPVVSYLCLFGRSKCCNSRIPRRYFITELSFPVATLGSYMIYGHYGAASAIFVLSLITLISKDLLTSLH